MNRKKIQGKFYPLQKDEWLNAINNLTHSELKVLYYLRSLDPYNKGLDLSPAQIARDLSTPQKPMHRSTVCRALKQLDSLGFIDMELLQVRIKVNPKGFLNEETSESEPSEPSNHDSPNPLPTVVTTQPVAPTQQSDVAPTQPPLPSHNNCCAHTTTVAPPQQSSPEKPSEQGSDEPKIIKTFQEFKESLSQEERGKFFNFVKEQIKHFSKPIVDLWAWLASKTKAGENRWQIYYEKFKEQGQKPVVNQQWQQWQEELERRRQTALEKYRSQNPTNAQFSTL
jgi:hypothetical protein